MAYTDSESAEATLELVGVWIHDPDDPEGSIAAFPYGSAARSTDYDAMGSGAFYAGRAHPVFDFGEFESEAVSVSIDVPHGTAYRTDLDTLRAFAASKKALWFRDNRGRAVHGIMTGFGINDQTWGAQVSFGVEQSDREIETAVA
jgi:hypothetical protein